MNEDMIGNLPVLFCSQPPVISQNIVDIQAKIEESMQTVCAEPRDREGLANVKAIRAQLRKIFEALEQQRMAVKKAVMEPYDEANAAYKAMLADPISKADAECKAFIDGVQNSIKQQCLDELKAYWDELVTSRGIPWLTFDHCPVKVDMATASKKDYKKEREQITAFVDKVEGELATISGLEDAASVLASYTQNLDLSRSMWAVQDQKRRLREAEAQNAENIRRNQERQKSVTEMARENPELASALEKPQEKIYRVAFMVDSTMPMLHGLKAFLDNNHYIYKEVTQ